MPRLRAWIVVALTLLASPLQAQSDQGTPPSSAILTIDQERLFNGSEWGKRATARLADESAKLAAENRALEAQLVAEEKELTDARPDMAPEAFRKAADAFDARVVEMRRTQDAKGRAIARITDAERQKFYAAALPVMGEVLRRKGAVVVLDSRAIFVSAESIDVTDEMIRAIDEALGAGEDAPDPAPEGGGATAPDGGAATPPSGDGAN